MRLKAARGCVCYQGLDVEGFKVEISDFCLNGLKNPNQISMDFSFNFGLKKIRTFTFGVYEFRVSGLGV